MKRMVLILLLLFAVGSVYSQGLDTVWTYNLQPDYLKNAVFSPDEQFVFATHYDYNFPEKLRLSKFEKATGKFLWKTDSIMGIKKFSDDGKFFYTYDLKKYSYPEFLLIDQTQIDKEIKFLVWELAINEKFNSLIVVNDRRFKDPPFYNRNYDSSLVFINSSNMKMENIISHRDTSTWLKNIAISPTKPQFITASSEGKRYIFDLWDLATKSYKKNISYYDKMEYYDKPIIHYSPDGKLLGILTDSLRLYETENYNWVYTLPLTYITYFNFNYDSNGIFLSSTNVPWFRYYKILTNDYIASNSILNTKIFINQNKLFEILTTKSLIKLSLVKYNNSSIENDEIPYINEIIQKDNEELVITANKGLYSVLEFEISNIQGKIIIESFSENVSENQVKINISSLKEGIYFLRIKKGSEEFAHKFIIVR